MWASVCLAGQSSGTQHTDDKATELWLSVNFIKTGVTRQVNLDMKTREWMAVGINTSTPIQKIDETRHFSQHYYHKVYGVPFVFEPLPQRSACFHTYFLSSVFLSTIHLQPLMQKKLTVIYVDNFYELLVHRNKRGYKDSYKITITTLTISTSGYEDTLNDKLKTN